MAESNRTPQDSSQRSPNDTGHDENLLSEFKDTNAPKAHPATDRFLIIRKSTPEFTLCSSSPHILRKIKTYRTDITIQSSMKNARRPPPHYILDDHLQADIDEALGKGASIITDRALVYISAKGDIAFLLGPNPFSRFSSTAVDNPTQYIFSIGKSRKDIDALGAWSPLATELPGVERDDSICEKLGESAKNWEYPIACTPIIFKVFSDKAKRRVLEAALEPQKRTLSAVDVSLEDGVTLFTQAERAEENKEGDVRYVADEGTLPTQSTKVPEEDADCQGETKGVVPALRSVMLTTSGSRAPKFNHDLPAAPMPPAVDRSVFVGFNPILPPEPDTPLDDSEDPTTSPPSHPEDQQIVQPPSPSALRVLFESSNERQPECEPKEEPEPAPNSEVVGGPALDVSSPESSPGLEQPGPATVQDNPQLVFSRGVQTDEGEKEEGNNTLQDTGRESGGLDSEDLSRGAGSDEANQTSSVPASTSPTLISHPVIPQQPPAGAGVQAELPSEENLWNLTSLLRFILALQIQTRTSSQEAHEVPAGIQNDVAAVVVSRLQTPDVALVPLTPTEAQHSAEEEPNASLMAQLTQESATDPDASQVGPQAPNHDTAPVSSVSAQEEDVQGATQSASDHPSTPAGTRRPRPKVTPPSGESQRRPPKRIRADLSGELDEVEDDTQAPVPLSPPPTASEQTHGSDSDHDTSMESVSAPDPHGKGKGKALSPQKNPAGHSFIGIPSYCSNPDQAFSLRVTETTSPPEMEWDPDVVFPASTPISPTQHRPNTRSSEGMDVDPEAPGPSLAGVAGSSTAIQVDTAEGTGLGTTQRRRIKRLRLITRRPQPTPTPSNDLPRTDVPMAIDEVGTSAPTHESSFPGYPQPPQPAPSSTVSHEDDAPVADPAGNHHGSPAEALEESESERDSPVPSEGEGNPTEHSAGEVDELDSDDESLDLLRGSSSADHGKSQEDNAAAAPADHEAESSDNESDFSDVIHEAKASKYNTSNASAAAEIEKELEDTSDPEIQPQAQVERRGSRLSASTAEFGLPESVGSRAGRSASPAARLASISSALNSYSISGPIDAGGSSVVSLAGGEPAADEDDEDVSPLL
ncbi:hypothetical protein FS837_001707 [Tulasnella sp. UAMH 9824]|nr:hypothetical protein FS837_001707 [Tulasnella sp. UAMH 9824]